MAVKDKNNIIQIYVEGHNFYYDLIELTGAFGIKGKVYNNIKDQADQQDYLLVSCVKVSSNIVHIETIISKKGRQLTSYTDKCIINDRGLDYLAKKSTIKRHVKIGAYLCMKQIFKKELEWGTITGVRPLKVAHKHMDKLGNWDDVQKLLMQHYQVSEKKAGLLTDIAKFQRKYIEDIDDKKISIYISVPFCVSRCIYCSFVSNTIGNCEEYVEPYVQALLFEIKQCIQYLCSKDYKIENVYVGGGTPTSLDCGHIEKILTTINSNINSSNIREYTVEAGRPDTITREKLEMFLCNGVNRISINPQTMNPDTLLLIRRNHSPEQVIQKYKMAKDVGLDWINMDLIIGLPSEDEQDVKNTINEILKLSPKNITVHTMALKRSSLLVQSKENIPLTDQVTVNNMMEIVKENLIRCDYKPYYLYRQKYMLGNLENIGFCRDSFESIYNIKMMGENQTIVAFGAGAVSKIFYSSDNRIERVMNVKNLTDYINRVEEMVQKKLSALAALTKYTEQGYNT
ncbi:MAG: coproporphyrinogen dehydrogenase HemZ [Clostridia bacterium]|nr:coproporphyrinogen dehydrogenase HemZ [Clostridia bacterium]